MKKVFLTGGSGDIGGAIKEYFIEKGCQVIAPAHSELDLSDNKSIENYFKNNDKNYDIFIHCAGFNNPALIDDLTDENLYKTANINYFSFIQIMKHLSPYMCENNYGKVLAISSLYGSVARSGRLAYVSSKHALQGAVKTYACEYGKYNMLFNCLSPGFVDTKMTRKNNSPEKIQKMTERIPLNKLADVYDIAKTAYYLCSDDNTYITGQNIIVDGGFMAEGGQHSL